MTKIVFKNISKQYDGASKLTINNANLEINAGEFCVFVGPSGCGKSTLLRMVAGLEDISAGEMFIEDRCINDLPPAQRGVAMVFQSYALYPHMTVAQNMAFGLKVLGSKAAQVDAKVAKAAKILQLEPLMDRLPKALSGGQRQRVAIGRAIVKEPKVFLFDEPLSNLDAALRVQTRLEIAKLHRDIGTASMIYVTHDQVEAMTLADKIVLLHTGDRIQSHGSIAQVGTPMDLYHRPQSLFVAQFIGSPKMNIVSAILESADAQHATVRLQGQLFTVAVDASHLPIGQAVSLGIRPEHALLGTADSSSSSSTLSATVQHVERLGDATLVYAQYDPNDTQAPLLTVRIEGHAPLKVGANLSIQMPPQALHLFDAQGQACVRTVDLPQ